ncbi:glycosyltransferase [Ancylobacter sp. MQZ15Z-1]|uniref:Glycosyltransferase n=1 Tax=Ancylobacter mangrovi TaxID=2972472 RepID=A0A9X2PGV8_9HYPH|nr:glycosyltransferase [Ancylobacter mangrovi]MCS0494308.1 glycosyltransferase [Ancylobacter mangrovi]
MPVEIAGLAGGLDPADLAYAIRRAERLGIGADEVLLAAGLVSADRLAGAAAQRLGLRFEPLEPDARPGALSTTPVIPPVADIGGLMRSGVLADGTGRLIVAARGRRLRELAARLAARAELRRQIVLTSPERLAAFARRRFGPELGRLAAFRLLHTRPSESAGTLGASRLVMAGIGLLLALLPFLMRVAPAPFMLPVAVLLAALLLGWCGLRLAACTMEPEPEPPPLRSDRLLPHYSLIVPLYREARVVPQLVEALDAIDYPREKLQILMVIEPDDAETTAAIVRHALRPGFEIVVAPEAGPKTKPKALNAALPFAHGSVIGIFDAEDVPDPLQPRRVCAVLQGARGRSVGCVQARLAIDNMADSWITRQFAAEYAGHFDVVLPMLGLCGLPVPLGGTSNHFRREVLERLGAWDPCNVTEDADLGVRLARAGWRTAVIGSTTDEEAPRAARPWLLQRTRWYKGWMQTLLVHGRHPRRLARETGWGGALALLFLLGGGVAAALMHPFFAIALLAGWLAGQPAPAGTAAAALEGIGVAVLVLGYASTLLCTVVGMRRRGLPGLARVVPLIPAYWLMMSLAAWRALAQLIVAPHYWEKTDHGLARTSRRRLRMALAVKAGSGSGPSGRPRGSGAARRPRPAASASD